MLFEDGLRGRVVVGIDDEAERSAITHWSIESGHETLVCSRRTEWSQLSGTHDMALAVMDREFALRAGLLKLEGGSQCLMPGGECEPVLWIVDDPASVPAGDGGTTATDFVLRPLNMAELDRRACARIDYGRSRRKSRREHLREVHGPLTVDRQRMTCRIGGAPVPLLSAEFRILCYLIDNGARRVAADELMSEVLGAAGDGSSVRSHICRLRAKFRAFGYEEVVSTVRGMGYRCVTP